MNKENHTVTVPREYLEMLEKAYENSKDYNMRGDIRRIAHPPDIFSPIAYDTKTLFLTAVLPNLDSVIIIDNEGREQQRFRK